MIMAGGRVGWSSELSVILLVYDADHIAEFVLCLEGAVTRKVEESPVPR